MISKSILVASLTALPFAAGIAHAGSPLLPLNSDGSAAIFFVADASVTYNDNIFYVHNKTGDTIFTLAPGFELTAGGDGNSKFDLVFKEALSAYADHSNLNTQLANVDATYTYDAQQAFKASLAAGFHQLQQPTNITAIQGTIVKSDTFYANANGQYRLTEKSSVTLGVSYNGLRYTNGFDKLFNDTDSVAIPVSWLYAVTDKLDAGFKYQYSYTDITPLTNSTQRTGDQQVNFLGLTANGQATEKLKLTADAGIGFSSLKPVIVGASDENDTTFNFTLTATYTITEKLTAIVSGGRNFSVGAQGQQVTTSNGTVGLNYAINEQWSANANIGYMVQEFTANPPVSSGGSDDIFTTGFGVAYQPDKYWKLAANYSFMNDDTSRTGASSFNDNVISLTASVKY